MQVGINTNILCNTQDCGWNDTEGTCFYPGVVKLNQKCEHEYVDFSIDDPKVENKTTRNAGAINVDSVIEQEADL